MVACYYNEFDPQAAAWLRNLIADGLIPPGEVDKRSIEDVAGRDLEGFEQVHLFAGIGGWPLALQIAGWTTEPVWTGSCPCQPFSAAGKRKGTADKRHLWPAMHRLVQECRPSIVFGEQVASADGRKWLAGVRTDLEALGYAVGAADLCAAGIGAPHIRQRLFWVADARCECGGKGCGPRRGLDAGERSKPLIDAEPHGSNGRLADAERPKPGRGESGVEGQAERWRHRPAINSEPLRLAVSHGAELQRVAPTGQQPLNEQDGRTGRLGHGEQPRLEGHTGHGDDCHEPGRLDQDATRPVAATGGAGAWDDAELVYCRDEKYRRVERGSFPLAHGIPAKLGPGFAGLDRMGHRAARSNRVVRLKGYGNAIVPQLAAEFIKAYRETVTA